MGKYLKSGSMLRNIIAGVAVTVLGGLILAIILRQGPFAPIPPDSVPKSAESRPAPRPGPRMAPPQSETADAVRRELLVSTLLFRDIFITNSNNWEEKDNGVLRSRVTDDKYVMELLKNRSPVLSGQDIAIDPKDDFFIETTARAVAGETVLYGLFWAGDRGDNHVFLVSPSGYYTAYKDEVWSQGKQRYGGSVNLIDPAQKVRRYGSPHIHTGNASNKLTVVRSGNSLYLYLNDRFIDKGRYSEVPIKRVGVTIGGQTKVEFKRFTVKVKKGQ